MQQRPQDFRLTIELNEENSTLNDYALDAAYQDYCEFWHDSGVNGVTEINKQDFNNAYDVEESCFTIHEPLSCDI